MDTLTDHEIQDLIKEMEGGNEKMLIGCVSTIIVIVGVICYLLNWIQ